MDIECTCMKTKCMREKQMLLYIFFGFFCGSLIQIHNAYDLTSLSFDFLLSLKIYFHSVVEYYTLHLFLKKYKCGSKYTCVYTYAAILLISTHELNPALL